jgi:nicotinamide-nucleotide amidase
VAGIGESWLAELIEPWEKALPANIKLAYLPTYSDLKLRLTAFGSDKEMLKAQIDELVVNLLPYIAPYHYGFDDESLETVIGNKLRNNKKNLAIAESCTGGYIAHKITSVPGSSDYFAGSITPYQNEIKIKILGVNEATIANHGAVSEQTVTEMAVRVRELFGSDYGLASSGIAGPGGGSDQKPVGTIWIACSDEGGVITKKLQLTKDRDVNIRMSAVAALNLLYQRLTKMN